MNNELYHHGIMGMKWGIRRYQYEDGTLTPKGQERYGKVLSNPRLQRQNKKVATYVTKRELESARKDSILNKKIAQANAKSGRGDVKFFESKAKAYEKEAKLLEKKLDSITNDKLVAGRDYITQTDYNVWIIPFLGASVRTEHKIIEKKDK